MRMARLGLVLGIGLLGGCGGVSSPDFFPQLKGVVVDPATVTAFDQLGQTRQYRLLGQYSTPPGSPTEFTLRAVDASGWESANTTTLGIDGSGTVQALRNGTAAIRGRHKGFTSPPHPLTVAAPVLEAISLDPASATLPLGLAQSITALGRYRLGDGRTETRSVSETLAWTSSDPAVASVPAQGSTVRLQSLRQSATPVQLRTRATNAEGSLVEGLGSYTVGAPELVQVLVRRLDNGSAPPYALPLGARLNLVARGIYTDSSQPRDLPGTVRWTSADTAGRLLALQPQPNGSLQVSGLALGGSSVTASAAKTDGLTAVSSAPAAITVGAAVLESLEGARILPNPANVVVGASRQLAVLGRFSDGSEAQLAPELLDWRVADETIAGIDAQGVALGRVQGGTLVSAALKQLPSSGAGSVSAPLTVTDAVCTGPLLASQGTTVLGETQPGLCLGCTVSDEPLAIDNDPTTFAALNVNAGLLNGYARLTATAAANVPLAVAGQRAGFIISRPPGELLSLALLGGVSVATLDATGTVLESAGTADGLRLTLLGTYVIGQDAYLLSMPVTQPFRGLRVSMSAGIATVAQSLRVNSSCATTSE